MGVIVRLERESFQVLNMHGKVVHLKHSAVSKKRDCRWAVALDSESNNIHVKDIVKVIDGPHSVSLWCFTLNVYGIVNAVYWVG